MRKSYSSGLKPGNYDYSSTKPYESDAEYRNRKIQEQADARERRQIQSASLEGERQRQEDINMGLNIGTSAALTAPLGIVSGTAVGFGLDNVIQPVFADPVLRDASDRLYGLIKKEYQYGKPSGVPQMSEADFEARRAKSKADQLASDALLAATRAELKRKEEEYKAAFHKPQYSQNIPFQTATVAPIQYIAPVVNSTDAQKKQRMDVYTIQQNQKLDALKKQNEEALNKQRSELQTLQNLQKNYYSTLQAEMAKQQSANDTVARLEAEQAMGSVQQETPAPRRRLPSTISIEGKVVGRGRRRK